MLDPMETHVGQTLNYSPYKVERNYALPNGRNIDFFLPELNLLVEVKQFSTPRTELQIEGLENVIVIQGMAAAKAFRTLLNQ